MVTSAKSCSSETPRAGDVDIPEGILGNSLKATEQYTILGLGLRNVVRKGESKTLNVLLNPSSHDKSQAGRAKAAVVSKVSKVQFQDSNVAHSANKEPKMPNANMKILVWKQKLKMNVRIIIESCHRMW